MSTIRRDVFALSVLLVPAILHAFSSPFPQEARYEVGFSPDRGSLDLVQKAIRSAKTEILVAAYAFTSKPIAQALVEASRSGVRVMVIADEKSNGGRYTATTFLANQGIPVRLNGHYAIHHHKFLVIDGATTETGSFNYTASATDKNAENVLVLWNTPGLASIYSDEWHRLWNEATPMRPKY
jgi:phosphatidylserine/phosphatidylglycerophosphate/cardiolipin synthase-like enzyme